MFTRRHTRLLAVGCTTAALAIAPSAASARPVVDPPSSPDSTAVEPAPVVRQVQPDGDGLAILLSGAALVVAAAGAGIAGRSQREVARIAGPRA